MFTHHDSLPTTTLSNRQETLTQNGKEVQQELSPKSKRVLIVDDDPDITLTFKKGLETEWFGIFCKNTRTRYQR